MCVVVRNPNIPRLFNANFKMGNFMVPEPVFDNRTAIILGITIPSAAGFCCILLLGIGILIVYRKLTTKHVNINYATFDEEDENLSIPHDENYIIRKNVNDIEDDDDDEEEKVNPFKNK